MKKRSAFVALALIVLAALFVAKYKDVVDRFNPLLTKEYVYVQIDEAGRPTAHGRVQYKLTGYNAAGKRKNVNFSASTQLPKGTWLKVLAKGSMRKNTKRPASRSCPKPSSMEHDRMHDGKAAIRGFFCGSGSPLPAATGQRSHPGLSPALPMDDASRSLLKGMPDRLSFKEGYAAAA